MLFRPVIWRTKILLNLVILFRIICLLKLNTCQSISIFNANFRIWRYSMKINIFFVSVVLGRLWMVVKRNCIFMSIYWLFINNYSLFQTWKWGSYSFLMVHILKITFRSCRYWRKVKLIKPWLIYWYVWYRFSIISRFIEILTTRLWRFHRKKRLLSTFFTLFNFILPTLLITKFLNFRKFHLGASLNFLIFYTFVDSIYLIN